ncbi:SpoIIE family protein phosphatase [Chloroflexus aggregans]|uniref:Protein serine/threonine phosphatase n=1 Tax=Chloroflexus aggregans (strain MD-66 / DSM 9485) TaxID=326427 RepID=B8G855_CHLAD|nr:SpoIIE family protein phosphatase [Chloroflexus aggregans]ACL26109.1 protein serine/threonine phosphatase [Chloroflexus aggregans DSM 9485]
MTITWGAALRPKLGQHVSGDAYLVLPYDTDQVLVSVIDGLGGGDAAADAARRAVTVLERHPNLDLNDLMQRADRALAGSRGAVMALLRIDDRNRTAEFVGVGNIGVHVYSNLVIKPISKNGIVGYRLPQLLRLTYTYNSGDIFVLYSDGITSRFVTEPPPDLRQPPQQIAEEILTRFGKENDDATVVVVRCE